MITDAKLDNGQKEAIIQAVKRYKKRFATDKSPDGLSQAKLAKMANISSAYMSAMMNGQYNAMKVGNNTVVIPDTYFHDLARAIGHEVDNKHWRHFDFNNFKAAIVAIETAVQTGLPVCISGNTGHGKSYVLDYYLLENPEESYRVDCAGDMTAKSFMEELADVVGVSREGSRLKIRKAITKKLSRDTNPKLFIDESEFLKLSNYDAIKSLMSDLKGICPVIIVGANGYGRFLQKMKDKERTPFPQILRRIKEGCGVTELENLSKEEVSAYCGLFGIDKKSIVNAIFHSVSNEGELCGLVRKFLNEIDETGEPMSEELLNTLL